jgi:hypothetical protein
MPALFCVRTHNHRAYHFGQARGPAPAGILLSFTLHGGTFFLRFPYFAPHGGVFLVFQAHKKSRRKFAPALLFGI